MNDHRTEQNRTEQNRTEQNRTEQNRTEQNRTQRIKFLIHGDWKSPHPGSEIHFFKQALMDSSPVVFMNLSEVDLIDFPSFGVAKILLFYKMAKACGKSIRLQGVSPEEKEMLSLIKLHHLCCPQSPLQPKSHGVSEPSKKPEGTDSGLSEKS